MLALGHVLQDSCQLPHADGYTPLSSLSGLWRDVRSEMLEGCGQ